RVDVGLGFYHGLGADLPGSAGTVLHHHRLMPSLVQILADDASGDVGAGTGGERDDHTDWTDRIVLGYRHARRHRDQRGRDYSCMHRCPLYSSYETSFSG